MQIAMPQKSKRGRGGCAGLMALLLALWLPAFAMRAADAPTASPVTHTSLKAASEAAAADQSLVLLVFSATWCGPCKMLKSQTLDSPDFLQRAGALQIVDLDVDADPQNARVFDVSSIPALFLLTADGKIVSHKIGFMAVLDLLQWLDASRARAKAGQWEGTAPGTRFDEFIKKAAGEGLNTNDLQRLVALLGDADPADRVAAEKLVLEQREDAMPVLIGAVGDAYLGTRISAIDLLQQLAPNAPALDPWQSPDELNASIAALQKWWAATGKIPPARTSGADAATESSIKAMIEAVRGDNPAQRTDAMAGLVRDGAPALPSVREAIRKSERTGDQRSLSLLEDIRWAILVPDSLDKKSGGVRQTLARGKSSERQAAASQLGHAGHEGLAALTELLNDSDPLVVESAVRAVSTVGGNDAIPALAALLQAGESNLRMTAAQALGQTKNPDAIKPLLPAFIDPNEVVACTALGALEEIESNGSASKKTLAKDATTALRAALADSRWRVRATAAEIIGKMQITDLTADVKKLLEDSDGFVVKNAMAALNSLGAAPETTQLVALGKRLPSLRSATVEMMLRDDSGSNTVKVITDMFNSSGPEEQLSILNAMAQNERSPIADKAEEEWKPLLTRATTASDSRIRRAGAAVLARKSVKFAAELVGPLLADEDSKTRALAAGIVLGILNGTSDGSSRLAGLSSSSSAKTNKFVVAPERLASWHAAIVQRPVTNMDLKLAAAIFATGDGKADLPLIEKTLGQPQNGRSEVAEETKAVNVIVSKLPWPEGKPILDRICASPLMFALAVSQSARASRDVESYLFEPARFRTSLEPAAGEDLKEALSLLAGYNNSDEGWTFWGDRDRTRAVDAVLVDSTNAAWRTVAIFSLGSLTGADKSMARFEKAVTDSNSWVRAAAAGALARRSPERATLEQRMGPLLADTNAYVATVAACALLEPEVRMAAGLGSTTAYFRFGEHYGGVSESTSAEERPLMVIEAKPAFLDSARKWLASTNEDITAFAILLAQYGEFDGLDRLLSRRAGLHAESIDRGESAILAAVALSHDPKYVPALRQIAAKIQEDWDLRKVLQALKGMTGPEARQLRLDINKRMRDTGRTSGTTMID
jgi:HEAT repeat protein/thiol-disulfide isomerase/thioredoxin